MQSPPIKPINQHEKSGIPAEVDPICSRLKDILHFLTDMFEKGHEYRTISVLRSALSSVHEKIDGFRVGSHPDVCLLLKEISAQRPPKPKYSCIWNASEVLTYIKNMGENEHLSLKQLTLKTCFLMAHNLPRTGGYTGKLKMVSINCNTTQIGYSLGSATEKEKTLSRTGKTCEYLVLFRGQ